MKRTVFGIVIAVCAFVVGVGSDRLQRSTYSIIWPEISALHRTPDIAVHAVDFCELLRLPNDYDGKIVRVQIRRETVRGTFIGLLASYDCSGFVRAECSAHGMCDLIPNLIGKTDLLKFDVEVTGRFLHDETSRDHVIEVQQVTHMGPLVDCPDGSKVQVRLDCPAVIAIDLRIDGIGIGSSQNAVENVLGRPLKTVKGHYNDGAGEREITLQYDGLEIDMLYAPNPEVVAFQVTSPKWDVSGIRVGDDKRVLNNRFGGALYGPVEDPDVKGGYIYASDAGVYVTIKVRDGKIVEISAAMPTC